MHHLIKISILRNRTTISAPFNTNLSFVQLSRESNIKGPTISWSTALSSHFTKKLSWDFYIFRSLQVLNVKFLLQIRLFEEIITELAIYLLCRHEKYSKTCVTSKRNLRIDCDKVVKTDWLLGGLAPQWSKPMTSWFFRVLPRPPALKNVLPPPPMKMWLVMVTIIKLAQSDRQLQNT